MACQFFPVKILSDNSSHFLYYYLGDYLNLENDSGLKLSPEGRILFTMERIYQFLKGIVIGIATVIPGVSGGTVMVVLKIYDDVLYSISWKNYKKYLPFLVVLLSGVLVGILLLSHVMTYLLDHYRVPVYYSFIGMVLGGVPMIYGRAKRERFHLRSILWLLLAFFFMIAFTWVSKGEVNSISKWLESGSGLTVFAWLVDASALSTFAMILPGISGSMVMILLGIYELSLVAVASFDFSILFPILIGAVIGGVIGLKLIKSLLREHPRGLYSIILGLILGSLVAIYPGYSYGGEGAISILLLLLFAWVSYFFSKA